MANPRKFSEKIALQKQKQDECSAEFERIMKEVNDVCGNTASNHINSNHSNSSAVSAGGGGGGSGSGSGASGGGASPEGNTGGGSPTAYRESRGRSMGVGPMRRPSERKQDRSPYGSSTGSANINTNNGQNIAYLSPPMDNNWRRSNSDSALHQSLNMAVAAENAYLPGDMHTLHANYQHHHGQRSPSPHAVSRHLSPQAQRRKGGSLMQQQHQLMQQHQQHNHHQQQQQQQHQQHQAHQLQMQQQQQMHLQHQVHRQQQQNVAHQHSQHQQQQQQQQTYNPKFMNCNLPANTLFKSLQEQQLTFANTGSLPDLTSVHYASPAQQLPQQQQQHLTSVLSPHSNARNERDQSSSPFSPSGGGGNPSSPYHQQQHSPTGSAAVAQTSSPHMSFKNLSAAGTNAAGAQAQNSAASQSNVNYNPLPTLGASSATSNLTDYRQPLNPPSPGSSPGLLTSPTSNELHTSAPASPIRSTPTGGLPQQQNLQGYDRYSPGLTGGGGGNNMDAGLNSLNPSFHNHFEQFSLGDSNSSPEQMQHQFHQTDNNFVGLDFEDFSTGGNSQQDTFSHDFNDFQTDTPVSAVTSNTTASTAATCNNNNNNNNASAVQQRILINQQQQHSNNNAGNGGAHINSSTVQQPTNNNANLSQASEIMGGRQDILSINSPIPSPSPSSPLPIPISPQSPHHQQLSLSLHSHSVQHSPHHSPMHSPHHNTPISASSPGVTTLSGQVSPANVASSNHVTNTNGSNHQQQQQTQQQLGNTPTTPNIPSIIFSDYSSNADYSREIFDSLDLDLGQIDVAGLQMLSDPNGIMIADPNIEDSFRRDLN